MWFTLLRWTKKFSLSKRDLKLTVHFALVLREFLLLRTYCTEGLIFLSVRWIQPSQQHGRRTPSFSSLVVRLTCSFLVSSFLTKVIQQIHSLRASGVRASQATSAFESEIKASRKSVGTSCTTPLEITLWDIFISVRSSPSFFLLLTHQLTYLSNEFLASLALQSLPVELHK